MGAEFRAGLSDDIVDPPKSGVWLLAVQKPIKRPGWWKGKFALFWMLASGGGGEGGYLSKGQLPLPGQSAGKGFYRRREGLPAETVQSALTVILKLVIGALTSVVLIVLGIVNLRFQG